MRDGDLAARAIHRERLGVAQIGRAGGRITRVADGHFADEVVQNFRVVENLRHEAHAVVLVKFSLVAGDDAGAFLAAMLERVKSVIGRVRRRSDGRKCRRHRNNVWDNFVVGFASRATLNFRRQKRAGATWNSN